jgi:hypothetical protein
VKSDISEVLEEAGILRCNQDYDELEFRARSQMGPPRVVLELMFKSDVKPDSTKQVSGPLLFLVGFTLTASDEGQVEENYSCLGLTTEASIKDRTTNIGTAYSLTNLASSLDGPFSIFTGAAPTVTAFPPDDADAQTLRAPEDSVRAKE